MAEFCKECFIKNFGNHEGEVIVMSEEKDICEGCGAEDYTVDIVEAKSIMRKLVDVIINIGW